MEQAIRRLQRTFRIMARTRRAARSGRGLLTALFETDGVGDWQGTPRHVRDIALACRLCRTSESRTAFRRLVLHVETHAGRLLHARCADGQQSYVMPLQRLAERYADWQRAPEGWRPATKNVLRQFLSLVRHLLGGAGLGRFLGDTLFVPPAVRAATWFEPARLGQGRAAAPAPAVPLTRQMALRYLETSSCPDSIRALRSAQALGLGGDVSLAYAVGYSSLAWQLWDPDDEEWWLDFLAWLARQPELCPDQVSRIVEYAAARRGGDPGAGRAPDLAFSCRGRTVGALERLIDESETRFAASTDEAQEFTRSGIRPGRWSLDQGTHEEIWTIEEILNSADLQAEGRTMRHCAAIYTRAVRDGIYSIWSMSCGRRGLLRRTATLRVANRSRRILECRGRANRSLYPEELRILRLWAEENALHLP